MQFFVWLVCSKLATEGGILFEYLHPEAIPHITALHPSTPRFNRATYSVSTQVSYNINY